VEEESFTSRARRTIVGLSITEQLEGLGESASKYRARIEELKTALGGTTKAATTSGEAARQASEEGKASTEAWRQQVEATRAEYEKLADAINRDLSSLGADPALKKKTEDATVLDINRLKDKARAALEGGDTKTAEEMIAKAQQINNALLDAGKITQGYYKTQAEQLLDLVRVGQTVVEGEPIKIPAAPDLASAIAAGMLASETAQGAVTPIIIPVEYIGAGEASLSNPDTITRLAPISDLEGYAGGGAVRGPGTATSDSVLARLSAGEFVVKAAAVGKYGTGLLSAINNLRLPRFATGGLVGGGSSGTATYRLDLNGRSLLAAAPAGPAADFAREARREVLRRGRR
jgi:hypothetical protein